MATTTPEEKITRYRKTTRIEIKDPDIKNLTSSISTEETQTIYNDEFPEGKTYTYKHGFTISKEIIKDNDGTIDRVICTVLPFNTGGIGFWSSLDTKTKVYDRDGKLIKEKVLDPNGVIKFSTQYFYEGDVLIKRVDKNPYTIVTKKYDMYGNTIDITSKTIKSKVESRKLSAEYTPGDQHRPISIKDYERRITTSVTTRLDENRKVIEESFITRTLYGNKVIEVVNTLFDPNHDYKVSRVVRNGELTEDYRYNDEGEVISVFLKLGEATKTTRLSSEVDPETGNKTYFRTDWITKEDGTQETKQSSRTYDANKNLLAETNDKGEVTTYTYDENNRRLTAVFKVPYNGELVTVGEVQYTYDDSDESIKTVVRDFTTYDVYGNKLSHRTDTHKISELRDENISEAFDYEVPSNNAQE